MRTIESKFAEWVDEKIVDLPKEINLIYFEYNTDKLGFACGIFGYVFGDAKFDPEVDAHLDILSDWQWESGLFRVSLEKSNFGNDELFDEIEMIENVLCKSTMMLERIRQDNLTIIYGLHDASPKLLSHGAKKRKRQVGEAKKHYYYELGFDYSGSHFIEKYVLHGIDENALFSGNEIVPYPRDYSIQVWLQEKGKPKDLLQFYRGWLVCSKRLVDLFKGYTSKIQTFSVIVRRPVSGKEELIEGYYAVNLFDKINCIENKWLKHLPRYTTFDPSKGYKVLYDKVKETDVFRINVYDYRLLVSQHLREEFDTRKITGVSWLKREVE